MQLFENSNSHWRQMMPWTVIAINPALEKAEHHVCELSPDTEAAFVEAQRQLPNRVVVAIVRGSHGSSTYVPSKTVQVIW